METALRLRVATIGISAAVMLALPSVYGQENTSPPGGQPAQGASLQDPTPSPSDNFNLSEAVGAGPGPVQMQLSDETQPSSNPAAAAPGNAGLNNAAPTPRPAVVPQRPRPQVATLGNNAFSSLARSDFYAGPLAVALGAREAASSSSSSGYFGSAAHRSLLETPEMFGDYRRPGSAVAFDPFALFPSDDGEVRPSDLPTASSFGGMRVSENNVALPQDRVWFTYNHLAGAFMQPGGDLSLDRFTVGVEKTFFGGTSSLEVRLPMSGGIDPVGTFGGTTTYAGGSFGNLQMILKRVLLANESRVIAVGLAIETPTGSKSHALDTGNGLAAITVDPTAVYLTPFIGAMRKIDDIWFVNSFIQIDVPTGGERLLASLNGGASQEFFLNQPTTLQIDIGGGVWLTTPERGQIGFALISELHIATALSQADSFQVDPTAALPNVFINQDASVRNLVNSTTGIHTQLNEEWSVRTAVSVPFLNERIFDTEFMVQVTRNY